MQKKRVTLTVSNAVPILLSADFLIVPGAVSDCINFIASNIADIAANSTDITRLPREHVRNIAEAVPTDVLSGLSAPL